jgi:hypothetical protein
MFVLLLHDSLGGTIPEQHDSESASSRDSIVDPEDHSEHPPLQAENLQPELLSIGIITTSYHFPLPTFNCPNDPLLESFSETIVSGVESFPGTIVC